MATSSMNVQMSITGDYVSSDATFGDAVKKLSATFAINLAEGNGSNQFNRLITGAATISSGGNIAIDCFGSTDLYAQSINSAKVIAVFVKNKETATGKVLNIGGSTANFPLFAATNDIITIAAGGAFMAISPVDGWTVTATTGDILKLAPGGSYSVSVEYVILLSQ